MEKPTTKICLVSRKKNFPFEKVLWACFLKKAAMQWSAKNLHCSVVILTLLLKVPIQSKRKGLSCLSTVILVLLTKWSWNFLFRNLFESRISMKGKRTCKLQRYHFDFMSKCASQCSCFESRNSTKMKRTSNCHFGFGFTEKLSWPSNAFFESHNSIKAQRTLFCHFSFTYKVKVKFLAL